MKDTSGTTSPPRVDTGNRGYWLKCFPTTVTVPSQYNKYDTGTDLCIPLTEESVSGERVVSTTQTRLTGAGDSQHDSLYDPRFAKLCEQVDSQYLVKRRSSAFFVSVTS